MQISKAGTRIYRAVLQADADDDLFLSKTYNWTCKHTGYLRWSVTMTGSDYDESTETEPTNGTASGALRIRRCGAVQPRRVRRGYVAASAADEYEDEFVSRSLCSPLTALVRGKASTWRCIVVHNNTYRQCETIFRMRYTQQSKFGVIERKEHVKRERTRCASF